jgi:hypothetical protein
VYYLLLDVEIVEREELACGGCCRIYGMEMRGVILQGRTWPDYSI